MNSTNANIINSLCLIVIGLWGYFEVSSTTALIPVGFGVALILCSPGVKKQNKVIAHIACLLYTSPSPRDRTRSRMPSSA